MSRRTLGLVLLVSLGVNVGILATLAVDRLREPEAPGERSEEPVPEETGDEPWELLDPATPETEGHVEPSVEETERPEIEEPAGAESETGQAGDREPIREAGDREPGLGEPVPFDPGTGTGGRPLRDAGEPSGGAGKPGEEAVGPRGEGPASGQGEPREMPQQIGWRLEALADRLGLAGEPRRRFLEVQRGFFRDTFVRRQEIHRLQRVMRQELTSPRPDRRRLAEATDRLAAAREELDRTFIQAVLDTRQVLNPDQEREYLRFLARLRAASEGRGEGPPPGRPGPGPRRLPPPP